MYPNVHRSTVYNSQDMEATKSLYSKDERETIENIPLGFPGGSHSKEFACNERLGFDPWVGKIPGGGHGNPLQYSCLEYPHGQKSLVGYIPWSRKESETTERLSTAQQFDREELLGRKIKIQSFK